ncbi:major facilitator superfamily domain-containing protein [Phyllosticta citriasiana]|uniref:Major facilitator superfamily domain-containing protein n=1 Tax=Phyllosticta citriasiana TaxID=595635 RepID=A0ABR1KPI8_9PEZI
MLKRLWNQRLPSSPTSSTPDSTSADAVSYHDNAKVEANIRIDPAEHEQNGGNRPIGVAKVEAVQALYGKYGKYCLWLGLAMIMIGFELDNSLVYTYQNYGTSAFNSLSVLSTLSTAGTIVSAVIKPPVAKISDVIGRGETYLITVTFYLLSYVLTAASKNINTYAAGFMFYKVGQSGTNILDSVVFSDVSSPRWRGFVLGISFAPFLIMPWISAFIVDDVTKPDGIGWRWGIGMFAIVMPVATGPLIGTLLYFQQRAKKTGLVPKVNISVWEFCSLIDLGGMILLCSGFAMLLLPFTLAASTPGKWSTPWVDVLIALGVVLLVALVPYEKYVAEHPVVPVHYGKNLTIVLACTLAGVDQIGFSATHTYLYAWATVAHNYSARDATFLQYTNGVTECLAGIIAGIIMYKTRRYKWLTMLGVIVRCIGYGAMIRLRGAHNSTAELFIVQLIQGIGSGFIQQIALVAAQVVVPHAELAQISSLVLLISFLGSAVGSCVAGGIYTNEFKVFLRRYLGEGTEQSVIDRVYDSITGTLPEWGSAQRDAITLAYSEVMKKITIVGFAVAVPLLLCAWFLPNLELQDMALFSVFEGGAETTERSDDNVEMEAAGSKSDSVAKDRSG